ncbi:hypothetical protein RRG08_038492 [Elysia crispata]|uniref:Uncharacterized protein n=1 Tax=Elysia crispata TaxID=231223 RepID=A0AAE1DYU6_9GAST|nr:hypothetical protein RRG08_038492 [Elysia crispata]
MIHLYTIVPTPTLSTSHPHHHPHPPYHPHIHTITHIHTIIPEPHHHLHPQIHTIIFTSTSSPHNPHIIPTPTPPSLLPSLTHTHLNRKGIGAFKKQEQKQ